MLRLFREVSAISTIRDIFAANSIAAPQLVTSVSILPRARRFALGLTLIAAPQLWTFQPAARATATTPRDDNHRKFVMSTTSL